MEDMSTGGRKADSIQCLGPNTGNKFTIFLKVIINFTELLMAANCIHRRIAKVIPVSVHRLPTGSQRAQVRVAICLSFFMEEHASKYRLANVNAILAEVIVETFDLLDAGQSFAINVVCEAAVFVDPAFLQNIDQGVLIRDCDQPLLRGRAER